MWAEKHSPQLWISTAVYVSYHAVHSEVVMLGLQLHGVGVVVADLCIACQEQTLVVHYPVEHLGENVRTHRRDK